MSETSKEICFVIAPIGEEGSDTRKRSDQVLRHIIQPAVEKNYRPLRTDEIAEPGLITNQIVQHLVNDPLVIDDLTEQNPNVFYELAIRHVSRKPIVQIAQSGQRLPFDVAETRTVFFDLQDPDRVANARAEVENHVKTLEENPSDVQTPVSVPLDLQLLRQSGEQDHPVYQELLSVLSELSDTTNATRREMQGLGVLSRRDRDPRTQHQDHLIRRIVSATHSPYAFLALISTYRWSMPWVYEFGMEAYRQVSDGNFVEAREIFREMENFIEFGGELQRVFSMRHLGDLHTLLERFIQYTERRAVDDLPF